MANATIDMLSLARKVWQQGDEVEAGRLIFESIPAESRPRWAARILELASNRSGIAHPSIDNVLQVAADEARWHEAHDAFSLIRDAVLSYEGKPVTAEEDLLLSNLTLAELVAKVTYNATNPDDEFDEDSGWWIAACLKDVLDLLNDKEFSESMWPVLCFEEA